MTDVVLVHGTWGGGWQWRRSPSGCAHVLASLKPTHHFVDNHDWASRTPGWSARKIASSHFPMTTMPEKTATLLMEIAAHA